MHPPHSDAGDRPASPPIHAANLDPRRAATTPNVDAAEFPWLNVEVETAAAAGVEPIAEPSADAVPFFYLSEPMIRIGDRRLPTATESIGATVDGVDFEIEPLVVCPSVDGVVAAYLFSPIRAPDWIKPHVVRRHADGGSLVSCSCRGRFETGEPCEFMEVAIKLGLLRPWFPSSPTNAPPAPESPAPKSAGESKRSTFLDLRPGQYDRGR